MITEKNTVGSRYLPASSDTGICCGCEPPINKIMTRHMEYTEIRLGHALLWQDTLLPSSNYSCETILRYRALQLRFTVGYIIYSRVMCRIIRRVMPLFRI